MMKQPDISVAIPVYNQETYIKQAIESTFKNKCRVEIVVLNDGSTDNTQKILESIITPEHVTLVLLKQENTGKMGLNMHRLYSTCSGRYISELGSDDFYVAGALDKLVSTMDQLPETIGFCYSGHWTMGIKDEIESKDLKLNPNPDNKYYHWKNNPKTRLLQNNFVTPPCALRSELYQQVEYDIDQDICEDYLFKLELSRVTEFFQIRSPLAVLRIRQNSISNNPNAKIQMKPWEDRAREKVKERHGW